VRPFIIAAGIGDLVSITGVTIANGAAAGAGDNCAAAGACGGAIKVASGQLLISKSVIRDNVAGGSGAGVAVTAASGAAVTIEASSFVSNAAHTNGGAIVNAGNNTITVTNTTFNNNAASTGAGAVVYDSTGTTSLNYVTAVDNYGAGSVVSGNRVSIRNSVLAQKSHQTPVCDNTVSMGFGNLVTSLGCSGVSAFTAGAGATSSGYVTFSQLRIGRLYTPANVGVPHFRLLTGSAAIDYIATDINSLTKDQMGNARPATDAAFLPNNDAGAVEKSAAANVRPAVALLTYPDSVDLNAYDTTALVPSVFAEFSNASASYSSLTPDTCTTDGNGLMLLKAIGTCTVETYVPDSTVSGTYYEEFFATTSFTVYVPHAPSIPTNMFIVTKTTSLKITFSPPADNGGSVITKYFIQVKAKTSPTGKTVECMANPCVVTGLLSDTEYSVNIVVRNRDGFVGTYPIANSLKTAATVTPTSPRSTTVKPGNKQVTLKWTGPRSAGQSKLLFYVVRVYKLSNLKVPFKEVTVAANKSFGTIKGLTTGTKYVAKVFAYNSGGASAPTPNLTFTAR
jgi:titin